MKRPRPAIPVSAKAIAARRKMISIGEAAAVDAIQNLPLSRQVSFMLERLKRRLNCDLHLDHDPALILRPFNPRTGKYTPDANDPEFLFYMEREEHQQKTTGRKPGAERTVTTKGSDIWVKTKFARLEKPRKKRQTIAPRGFGGGRKQKIPSRPFPKRSDP